MDKEEIRQLLKERFYDLDDTSGGKVLYQLKFKTFNTDNFELKVTLRHNLSIEQVRIVLDSIQFVGDYLGYTVVISFFERGGLLCYFKE